MYSFAALDWLSGCYCTVCTFGGSTPNSMDLAPQCDSIGSSFKVI